jgi:translocation and assembly module TamA
MPGPASRLVPAAALALAALWQGCVVPSRGTPKEPIVTSFRLEGVTAFGPGEILEKLATQEPRGEGLFGFLRKEATPLDPDALAVDRRRVEAFYRERGYYDARVEAVDVLPDGTGRVKVVMRVHEGAPVHVSRIEVTGLEEVPEVRAKLGKLPLREGQIFTYAAYDGTRAAILDALRRNGYPNAEVTRSAQVLPEEGTAEVAYAAKPGARYQFGSIFVAGSKAVARSRIVDEAQTAVKPGALYDESKLTEAQRRIFGLGVFGGVRVSRGTPNEEKGTVPVVVAVREAPFRTVRAGPGLTIEAPETNIHVVAGWTDRNWFGDLRQLMLDGRFGYAWLPNLFHPIKQGFIGLARAEFSQPGVLGRSVDVTTRVELERGLQEAYNFWAERFRLGFPVKLTPRLVLVPSYNFELYQLSQVTGSAAPTPGSAVSTVLQNCQRDICLLSYFEQRFTLDLRDNPVSARRGFFLGLSVQEGFHLAGFGYTYLRFLPEARAFLPLGRTVLAARARMGALVPVRETGQPPIVARFMAGGPLSMRGYYTDRLSPMVANTLGSGFVPVGGNGLLDASLELRFPVAGNWGGAVFVDMGNVSLPSGIPSAWTTALDPSLLQWAGGLAVRWATPVGLVRVDVGARFPDQLSPLRFPTVPVIQCRDPANPSSLVNCNATHSEPIVAVFVSLGEAF